MSASAAPSFTLFTSFYSTHGQKALFAAAESGAAYSVSHVDFFNGGNRSSDFLSVNPLGFIPALRLEDGSNRGLGECRPIAKFIAENFAEHKLYPKGKNGFTRAKIDEWLSFEQSTTTPLILIIADETMFVSVSAAAGRKGDAARLNDAVARLSPYLDYLERQLSGREWLVGDSLTLADLVFAPELQVLLGTPFADLVSAQRRPNVSAWVTRLLERPAWKTIAAKGGEQMNADATKAVAAGKKINVGIVNGLPRNRTETDDEPIANATNGKK